MKPRRGNKSHAGFKEGEEKKGTEPDARENLCKKRREEEGT